MIEGFNSTSIDWGEYDADTGSPLIGSASMSEVLDDLQKRRNNLLGGGINCIPLPFERFRSELPGVEQEQYIVLTAAAKIGKSQCASYIYLYSVLEYAFNHRDECSVHIIYFGLEESQQRIMHRYISHLLYKLDNYRISPTDLRSTSKDFPLPQEILDKLSTDTRYTERLKFFEECVQFESEETNPTGILRVCEEYAKKVGDYETVKGFSRGNEFQEVNVFHSYTPHDPKHYKMVFIDHAGLIDQERGMSLKASMDKLSEYAVKYLRNRYKFTVVWIQQQAMESEGLEAIKQKRMVPSVSMLGDTKYTARDADVVLALFDPSQFGLKNWLGYRIDDDTMGGLKSHARFLYILRYRNGESGAVCPLFFDGAVCDFEELPRPDDQQHLQRFYDKVKSLKTFKQKSKFTSLVLSLIGFFNGKRK